jgi:hypothetical protein
VPRHLYDALKVVLLYGPMERHQGQHLAINVFTRHVNSRFHRGSDLKDTREVLQGDGRRSHHSEDASCGPT